MDYTEYGLVMASFISLSLYILCMFDFPIRKGRNIYLKYEGLSMIIYTLYSWFFIVIALLFGVILTMFVGLFMSIFSSIAGIISGNLTFIFFAISTIHFVELRSDNEELLLTLDKKQ